MRSVFGGCLNRRARDWSEAANILNHLDPDWQQPAKSQPTAVSVIISAGREK